MHNTFCLLICESYTTATLCSIHYIHTARIVNTSDTNNTTELGSACATCPDPVFPGVKGVAVGMAVGMAVGVVVGEANTVVDVGCRSPLSGAVEESLKLWLLEIRYTSIASHRE